MSLYDATQVYERLKQFSIADQAARRGWLLKAERLTPDSEAYAVLSTDRFYVLYTEDFIQSLDYIQETVEKWFDGKLVSFIKPKEAANFTDSFGSQYYTKPDKEAIDKWMPYALPDGGDFTFLLEVAPNKTNDSYWVQSRLNPTTMQDLPAEVQQQLKKHMPIDPKKNFLETWQDKDAY